MSTKSAIRNVAETMPAATSHRVRHSMTADHARLKKYFIGQIDPVRISIGYQLALIFVAMVMLLLPLAYLALVGCVIWLIVWHGMNNHTILTGGSGILVRGLVYIAPLVAGPLVVAAMVLPMFSRSSRHVDPFELERHQEPLFFAFVDLIADALGAKPPVSIRLTPIPNAAAGYASGLSGVFTGRMELIIGTPLLAGLDARQLAGVIAHELGHCTQGWAVRLSYLVRTINNWLGRIVFERGRFDEMLQESAAGSFWWWQLIMVGAIMAVYVARMVLFAFMMIGHFASTLLLRQMEFDADRFETRLVGSETFAATVKQLSASDQAFHQAMSRLPEQHGARQLPDNLPALVAATASQLRPNSQQAQEYVQQRQAQLRSKFSTHPPDEQRIANAAKERADGVCTIESPSSSLFLNFETLCKWSTIGYYRMLFGDAFDPSMLTPARELIRSMGILQRASDAADRFFCQQLHPLNLIFPEPERQLTDASDPMKTLHAARSSMQQQARQAAYLLTKIIETDDRLNEARTSQALARAGVRRGGTRYGSSNAQSPSEAIRRLTDKRIELTANLKPFRAAACRRVAACLLVLSGTDAKAKFKDPGRLLRHAVHMHGVLNMVRQNLDTVYELSSQTRVMMGMLECASSGGMTEQLGPRLFEHSRDLHRQIGHLASMLRGEKYPFEGSNQAVSLAAYVAGTPPPTEDLGALITCAVQSEQRMFDLYRQAIGRLAIICEKVEASHDLKPLVTPDRAG